MTHLVYCLLIVYLSANQIFDNYVFLCFIFVNHHLIVLLLSSYNLETIGYSFHFSPGAPSNQSIRVAYHINYALIYLISFQGLFYETLLFLPSCVDFLMAFNMMVSIFDFILKRISFLSIFFQLFRFDYFKFFMMIVKVC